MNADTFKLSDFATVVEITDPKREEVLETIRALTARMRDSDDPEVLDECRERIRELNKALTES